MLRANNSEPNYFLWKCSERPEVNNGKQKLELNIPRKECNLRETTKGRNSFVQKRLLASSCTLCKNVSIVSLLKG